MSLSARSRRSLILPEGLFAVESKQTVFLKLNKGNNRYVFDVRKKWIVKFPVLGDFCIQSPIVFKLATESSDDTWLNDGYLLNWAN